MLGVGSKNIATLLRSLRARRDQGSSLEDLEDMYRSGSASYSQAVDGLAAERVPFEDYVGELAKLGLHGRTHDSDEYAAVLGVLIHRRIIIAILSNAEFARGSEGPTGSGRPLGRLIFVPGSDAVSVEVPTGLSPWLHQFTVAHELGHLAAAHPPRTVSERGTLLERDGGELSHYRLARRPPLTSGLPDRVLADLYEAEADLRAQYAMVTASLGPVALRTSKLTQIA